MERILQFLEILLGRFVYARDIQLGTKKGWFENGCFYGPWYIKVSYKSE